MPRRLRGARPAIGGEREESADRDLGLCGALAAGRRLLAEQGADLRVLDHQPVEEAERLAVAVRRRSPASRSLIAGAVLYAGAFVVTMAINVPLNNELAAAGAPDRIADLAAVRHGYEGPWVAWNLVRTLLSTGALVALVSALARTGGALRRR
jgi:hypothetical protein